MAVARSGAPFHSLPAPTLGGTGPVTMAGALAQQHAEVLASFVIAAAARPGAPVVYCSRISSIDLRTAVSSWGMPEVACQAPALPNCPPPGIAMRQLWPGHQLQQPRSPVRLRTAGQRTRPRPGRR